MATIFTREELYALVWDRPMTKLATEFSLSDVALHKICRKHNIPTPPLGYWAKKTHGKPVKNTPLPKDKGPAGRDDIVIHEGAGSSESEAMSTARAWARTAAERQSATPPDIVSDSILERTIAKLLKARLDRTGIARVTGKGLISVAVRPESVERTERVLRMLAGAARAASISLEAAESAAVWRFDGETVSFELVEAADRLAHVPTEAELTAVAKWEAKREADRKRYGYASDWGRPHIPKWEHRFQGRLSVRLEEVRIRTENQYWGPAIRRVFVDSKIQDVMKMGPRILSTIAAMAVAKRENRDADERRRLAEKDAARRRAEAERRASLERKRVAALEVLLAEQDQIARLEAYLGSLERSAGADGRPIRVERLACWVHARLERMREAMTPAVLDERLACEHIFDDDSG